MTKAVLFDLDDTLFDHIGACRIGLDAVRQGHAFFSTAALDDLEFHYREMLEALWPDVLEGRMTQEASRHERFRRLARRYNLTMTEAEGVAAAACYRDAFMAGRQCVPGAAALLQHLKPHVTIGIITNNFVAEQRDKLQHCGLADYIDFMITSEEVGSMKPHAAMFEAALRAAGCAAHEAVLLGDSWSSDIIGAHALGLRAVWLNRYGAACPDPQLATEITALVPTATIATILLKS